MGYVREINAVVNRFVWGQGMLAVFLFVGVMFTVRTGFFQFTKMRLWFGETIGEMFRDRRVRKTEDTHSISQFQSFCTALAATLGTGNIAGVAAALIVGGPGAIFWMWISALLGMMTIYAENLLGIRYRYKNRKGEWVGGAMVYMERGLGCKWLAVVFAVFCVFASFGMGNMTQANSIASGLKESFSVPPFLTGVLVTFVVAVVVLGGVKRIAAVTEKMVPLVALFYVSGAVLVLIHFRHEVPRVFAMIFQEAFHINAVGGGALGYGVFQAVKIGISRGVFSNEAGLGSSVMAHAASDVKSPVVQGMWGILEVFIDTIVVCTMTALVILSSGVYQPQVYLQNMAYGIANVDGTTLTGTAFSTVIPCGDKFLAISIALFAFATMVGWAYFGERTFAYLFGEKSAFLYKLLYVFMILPGGMMTSELAWEVADTFNGLMALPNLTALILLSGEVVRITKNITKKYKK